MAQAAGVLGALLFAVLLPSGFAADALAAPPRRKLATRRAPPPVVVVEPPPAGPPHLQFSTVVDAPVVEKSRTTTTVTVDVAPLVLQLEEQGYRVLQPTRLTSAFQTRVIPITSLRDTPIALPALPQGVGVVVVSPVDLVFGCDGDIHGARLVEGRPSTVVAQATQNPTQNNCAVRVDMRLPCASGRARSDAQAQQAKVRGQFQRHGPALLFAIEPVAVTSRLFVVEYALEAGVCGCGDDQAIIIASRVVPLQVPRLLGKTNVVVPVARYTGAMYDVVTASDIDDVEPAVGAVSLTDTFVATPPENPQVVRVFSAPAMCGCDACDDLDEASDDPSDDVDPLDAAP